MMRALVELPAARLTSARRGWLAPAGWCALVVARAVVARVKSAAAVDRVVQGTYADFGLPLLAFAVVSLVLGGGALTRASAPLLRLGARPERAALAHALAASLGCALLGAALGALAVVVAHRAASAPLLHDVAATAYAGALGGAAYAALFTLGSAFGAKGAGRGVLLFADFLFGAGSGIGALALPRAHVRNLLGEPGDLPLAARSSGLCLLALALVYAVATALIARRSRA